MRSTSVQWMTRAMASTRSARATPQFAQARTVRGDVRQHRHEDRSDRTGIDVVGDATGVALGLDRSGECLGGSGQQLGPPLLESFVLLGGTEVEYPQDRVELAPELEEPVGDRPCAGHRRLGVAVAVEVSHQCSQAVVAVDDDVVGHEEDGGLDIREVLVEGRR